MEKIIFQMEGRANLGKARFIWEIQTHLIKN